MRSLLWVVAVGLMSVSSPALAAKQNQLLELHIDSNNPKLELLRYRGTSVGHGFGFGMAGPVIVVTHVYEPVCVAPCDQSVPNLYPNEYVLGGEGITKTSRFSLSDYNGSVTIKADAGSSVAHGFGKWMTYFGGALTLAGGVVMITGAQTSAGGPSSGRDTLFKYGGYIMAVGVPVLVTGIVLWALNTTDYSIHQGPAAPAPAPDGTETL